MDKLFEGFLEKAYNKTPEEISELLYQKTDGSDEVVLKENALDVVLGLDEERVNYLRSSTPPDKDQIKKLRDEMRAEVLTDFEKKLKARFNVESSLKGLDLVQEIVDQVSECEISDDKIKQHPAFLKMEQEKLKELEELQKEHEEYKLNQDRRTRFERVKQEVLGIFSTLNPIESQNMTVANNRRNDMLRRFEPFEYEIKDNGEHFVMLDGRRVEDKHGNAVKFVDFAKEIIGTCYDFAQNTGAGNAGNDPGNGHGTRTDVPKTEAEYLKMSRDLLLKNDKEGLVKLNEAWKLSQKS